MASKNTTLSEQFQNLIEIYHTVGTVPTSNRKIIETVKINMLSHFTGLEQKWQG
jgi:hypothetical protein